MDAALSAKVAELPELSRDEVLALIDIVAATLEKARAVKKELDAALIPYIQEHGELRLGTKRYYVTRPKTTKCRDVNDTMHAVFEAAEGDLDGLCGTLSSNAFKPGACKKLLTDAEWHACFEVTQKDKLEVVEVDDRYLME